MPTHTHTRTLSPHPPHTSAGRAALLCAAAHDGRAADRVAAAAACARGCKVPAAATGAVPTPVG
eukprot:scaffold23965_cov21-Tisochrysis_lutea.AAC.1